MPLNPFTKYLKRSYFNKILLTYSLIILFALLFLAIIVSNNVSSMIYNNEVAYNKMVLHNLNNYFDNKYQLVTKIISKTYFDSYIQPDAMDFIENNYEKPSIPYINLKSKFDNYFMSIFEQDKDIYDVIVYKAVNKTFYLYSRDYIDEFDYRDFKYSQRLDQIDRKIPGVEVTPAISPNYLRANNKIVFTMSINIKKLNSNNVIGLLMIDFDPAGISSYLSQYGNNLKGNIIIMKKNGEVIYDSSNEYYGKNFPYINALKSTDNSLKIKGEECIINVDSDNKSGVVIAGITPKKEIFRNIESLKNTIFVISILCIFAIILLTYLSTSLFSKRIKVLTNTMKKIRTGDLTVRIPVNKAMDEISEISISFNKMCDDLNKYIEKVYISDIKQKSAELTALQAQINPHFLYNTLEAIRMSAISNEDHETGEMIYLLSQLFRNSIKEDSLIEIKDEIKYSQLYLNLFKIRYGEKLCVEFDIDNSILEFGIIKHLIQPIIENYIIHGFDIDNDNNIVKISGYKDRNFIIIKIFDNGRGMSAEKLDFIKRGIECFDINSNKSIGLANINERIKIIYGKECGLDIECEEGKGTTVTVQILAKTIKELKNNVQGINSR